MHPSDDDPASSPDLPPEVPGTPAHDAMRGAGPEAPAPAPFAAPLPAVEPERVAGRAPRLKWRQRLLYVLAALGALVLVAIALFLVLVSVARKRAPTLDRDAVIEESMTRNYGKYAAAQQGWLYVDPDTRRTYVMQVLQRAQVDVPSTTMREVTAVYFLVSGTPVAPTGDKSSLLGLFMIQPDTVAHDGTLTETSDALETIDGDTPVTAQDVHFEALSKDTWGWVVKIRRHLPTQAGARAIDNVVYAPHEGHIAVLATFPASAVFTASEGCEAAQAVHDGAAPPEDAASGVATAASAAPEATASMASASPASDAAAEADDEHEEADVPPALSGCFNAAWTYSTGEVPADGFVTISVKGGGLVAGSDSPVKTYKLVFDPKSFTYVLPPDMPAF
jgi:hypothetical protein